MALLPVVSVADKSAVLSLDVVNDTVVGVHLANNSGAPVRVRVTRPNGAIWESDAPPGESSLTIPRGRQFPFAAGTADWQASITLRWP